MLCLRNLQEKENSIYQPCMCSDLIMAKKFMEHSFTNRELCFQYAMFYFFRRALLVDCITHSIRWFEWCLLSTKCAALSYGSVEWPNFSPDQEESAALSTKSTNLSPAFKQMIVLIGQGHSHDGDKHFWNGSLWPVPTSAPFSGRNPTQKARIN